MTDALMTICPHCSGKADVKPAPLTRFRCRVCGGPRVPVDDSAIHRSNNETRHLAAAKSFQKQRAAWAVGGAILAVFGVIAALFAGLALAFVDISGPISTVMLIMALTPLVLAIVSGFKAAALRSKITDEVEEAWVLVATDVLAQLGEDTRATQLASLMRIDDTQAELLLGQASVRSLLAGPSAQLRVENADDESESEPDSPTKLSR